MSADLDQLIERIDQLTDECKVDEALTVTDQAVEAAATDPRILWRAARSYNEAGVNESDSKKKIELLTKANEFAKSCIASHPDVAEGYKWEAISLAKLSSAKGTKEKIGAACAVRDGLLKAAELNPNDYTTQHALGVWYFSVANIGWMERKIAAAIFGTPPTATFEEAEAALLKSHELRSTNINNVAALVEVYAAMKKKDEASKLSVR